MTKVHFRSKFKGNVSVMSDRKDSFAKSPSKIHHVIGVANWPTLTLTATKHQRIYLGFPLSEKLLDCTSEVLRTNA